MSMPGSLLSLVVWFSPSLTNYIIVERSNWRAVAWLGASGKRKTEWLSVKIIKFKHTHILGEGRTRCHIFVCSIRRAWVVATSVKRLKCSPVIVCSLGWQRRTAAPAERWQQQQQRTGNNHIIWNHLISTKRLLLPLLLSLSGVPCQFLGKHKAYLIFHELLHAQDTNSQIQRTHLSMLPSLLLVYSCQVSHNRRQAELQSSAARHVIKPHSFGRHPSSDVSLEPKAATKCWHWNAMTRAAKGMGWQWLAVYLLDVDINHNASGIIFQLLKQYFKSVSLSLSHLTSPALNFTK